MSSARVPLLHLSFRSHQQRISMHRVRATLIAFALPSLAACAGHTGSAPADVAPAMSRANEPLVEFEMMTWPEVKAAMAAGKTTALIYTGGTEQRGPQNVNGGHTLMARATVRGIGPPPPNAIST